MLNSEDERSMPIREGVSNLIFSPEPQNISKLHSASLNNLGTAHSNTYDKIINSLSCKIPSCIVMMLFY